MWSYLSPLLSPKKFFGLSFLFLPWCTLLFCLLFTYGLIDGLFFVPPDYIQGDAFRILYVHVPCAFASLFIYAIMSMAAFGSLVFQLKLSPFVISHSTPLGAGFTALALLTGSLWGKPMWGTFWIWDARLSSELILLFIYLGILLLQSALKNKRRAQPAIAIFVLAGAIDLPVIHYSVYWWNTLHQGATLKLFAPATIAPSMLHPLLAMIAAFILYYVIVVTLRIRHHLAQENKYASYYS